MCPFIGSETLHPEPTDLFMTSEVLTMWAEEAAESGEGMCSVFVSKTLHNEPTVVLVASEINRHPLTKNPDNADRGDR